MGYSFPSTPKMTISSYFLDKLTTLRALAEKQAFSVGVSRVLLSIWARCLEEKFVGSIRSASNDLQPLTNGDNSLAHCQWWRNCFGLGYFGPRAVIASK